MQEKCMYPIELVKKESVETLGKCFIPKGIMKKEKIQSGSIIKIESTINENVCCFVLLTNCRVLSL